MCVYACLCWRSGSNMQTNQCEGVQDERCCRGSKGWGAMSSSVGSSSSRSTGRLGIHRPATAAERTRLRRELRRRQQQRGSLTPVARLSHKLWLDQARRTQTRAMLLHRDGIVAHVQKQKRTALLGAICLISLGRAHHGGPAAGAAACLPAALQVVSNTSV